jgi:hypothetical protein
MARRKGANLVAGGAFAEVGPWPHKELPENAIEVANDSRLS